MPLNRDGLKPTLSCCVSIKIYLILHKLCPDRGGLIPFEKRENWIQRSHGVWKVVFLPIVYIHGRCYIRYFHRLQSYADRIDSILFVPSMKPISRDRNIVWLVKKKNAQRTSIYAVCYQFSFYDLSGHTICSTKLLAWSYWPEFADGCSICRSSITAKVSFWRYNTMTSSISILIGWFYWSRERVK